MTLDRDTPCPACGSLAATFDGEVIECPSCRRTEVAL